MKSPSVKRLFIKALLEHPFPAVYWRKMQVNDEKVTWLYMTDGTRNYLTTVTPSKWKHFSDQAKADLLNYMEKKMYNL